MEKNMKEKQKLDRRDKAASNIRYRCRIQAHWILCGNRKKRIDLGRSCHKNQYTQTQSGEIHVSQEQEKQAVVQATTVHEPGEQQGWI